MRPHDGSLKRFRKTPAYTHHRSEGLTRRNNSGTHLQPMGKKSCDRKP